MDTPGIAELSAPIRFIGPRRVGRLRIERLPITYASFHKLGPRRHNGNGIGLLRKEPPERRVMPTQLVPGAIAMNADRIAQLSDLLDQIVARHSF